MLESDPDRLGLPDPDRLRHRHRALAAVVWLFCAASVLRVRDVDHRLEPAGRHLRRDADRSGSCGRLRPGRASPPGIAGVIEMLGNVQRFGPALSNNIGYTGVVVAVLAGGLGPQLLAMALVFAAITVAGNVLAITGAPSELVFAMYGLTLICAAVGQGLRHVRIVNPARGGATAAPRPIGPRRSRRERRAHFRLDSDRDPCRDARADRGNRRAPRRDGRRLQHRNRGRDAVRSAWSVHRRPADGLGRAGHARREWLSGATGVARVRNSGGGVQSGRRGGRSRARLPGLGLQRSRRQGLRPGQCRDDDPVLGHPRSLGHPSRRRGALPAAQHLLSALLLPVGVWFLLYRTRHGLNMRSIGEDPGAADATGLSVNGWRIFYVSVGGAFAGLGGAVLTLGIVGTWLPNVTAGQGWIALAVVIFASWRPLPLIVGALLFGALGTFGNVAQAYGWSVPSEFFSALPYWARCWWSASSPACGPGELAGSRGPRRSVCRSSEARIRSRS